MAALIGLFAFLGVGAFFMVNVPLPPWSYAMSAFSIVAMAMPCFWFLTHWVGRRDAVIVFAALGVLALAVETLGLSTGFPYGRFAYSDLLGVKLFALTPWTVFFAWSPIVLAAYAVACRVMSGQFLRIASTAAILVVIDMVVDPGAVRLGFWAYDGGGAYYSVPVANFVGWALSGVLAAVLLEIYFKFRPTVLPAPVQLISSGVLILFLWTSIDIMTGFLVPSIIGVLVLAGLMMFYQREHYAFDDVVILVDEDGRPIGTQIKADAHHADTALHRAFSIFLFDREGKLLLQQRALTKKTWPGVWSNSCCGHLMLHESVTRAARRRVMDELGLKIDKLEVMLPDFRYRAEKDGIVENELCPVLIGFVSSVPRLNPDEVNDLRWTTWEDFVAAVADPANGYSPWAMEEVALLDREPAFKRLVSQRGKSM